MLNVIVRRHVARNVRSADVDTTVSRTDRPEFAAEKPSRRALVPLDGVNAMTESCWTTWDDDFARAR